MAAPKMMPTASLSLHPRHSLIPQMPADQFDRFLADVTLRGIVEPIELLPGTRTVIEGRTRLRAATLAGLAAVPVVEANLGGDTEVLYMLRAALLRRHLTKSQAAALAVELEAELKAAAKERQIEGAIKGGRQARSKVPEKIPEASPKKNHAGESREKAAAAAGVNPRYVSDAKQVKEKDPLLFEQVKNGKKTLSDAKREIAPPPGPVVCKPVGTLPLTEVPGFPAAAAAAIATKGVKTLADLEQAAAAVRAKSPKDHYADGIDNSIIYRVLNELGIRGPDTHAAGDAVIDLFMVKPMKAAGPAYGCESKEFTTASGKGGIGKVKKSSGIAPEVAAAIHDQFCPNGQAEKKAAAECLKPCPFCGSADLKVILGMMIHVRCSVCLSEGPKMSVKSEAQAREAWNRRSS